MNQPLTALDIVTGSKKKITVQQEQFLAALLKTDFDFDQAKKLAGYSDSTPAQSVAWRLKDQINDLIEITLLAEAAKSIGTLRTIRDSNKPIVNAATKAEIAKTFLDRAGHGKKETLQVDHEIKHGIFILPQKKDVVIDVKAEEDSISD